MPSELLETCYMHACEYDSCYNLWSFIEMKVYGRPIVSKRNIFSCMANQTLFQGRKPPRPNIEKEKDLVESSFKPKKSDGNGA